MFSPTRFRTAAIVVCGAALPMLGTSAEAAARPAPLSHELPVQVAATDWPSYPDPRAGAPEQTIPGEWPNYQGRDSGYPDPSSGATSQKDYKDYNADEVIADKAEKVLKLGGNVTGKVIDLIASTTKCALDIAIPSVGCDS